MKNSRTNITEKAYAKKLNKGMSSVERSVLWREAGHYFQPEDELVFESDGYKVDGKFGAVLTIYIKDGSNYKLPKAWGVNTIPTVSDPKVSVSLVTNIGMVPEKEVIDKISEAVKSARGSAEEAEESGQLTDSTAAEQLGYDMEEIAIEIKEGRYMSLSLRVNILAETQDSLDRAIREIEIGYNNWFNKLSLQQFIGEQQKDFRNLFANPRDQLGYNYKMTSQELSGMSPFITRGLEDEKGIFVGRLAADVNSGAVMLDTQQFDRLAMVGARGRAVVGNTMYRGITKSSLWGIQYANDALLRGNKVHHIVLNNADPLKYGQVDMSDLSTTVDLSKGNINILEVFGDKKRELELFSIQLEKLKLIVRQLDPDIDENDLLIFNQRMEQFYIDQRVWVANAKAHKDELRLVGIPSNDVPKFEKIAAYFLQATLSAKAKESQEYDESDLKTLKRFQRMFNELYKLYGDIFGKVTSIDTQKIRKTPQTIYNFQGLQERGKGVFLAQVINGLAYLSGNISQDDVVIIHGAQELTPSIYEYFQKQVEYYWSIGAKVVMLFDAPKSMLNSKMYDEADTTLIGPSSKAEMDLFSSKFDNALPDAIRSELVESNNESEYYFRRGMESALFKWEVLYDEFA